MKTHHSGKLTHIKKGKVLNPDGIGCNRNGRAPDWFKTQLKKIVSRKEMLRFFADVISGAKIEPHVTGHGVVYTEASTNSRVYAWERACDRGFGKTLQELNDVGVMVPRMVFIQDNANSSPGQITNNRKG